MLDVCDGEAKADPVEPTERGTAARPARATACLRGGTTTASSKTMMAHLTGETSGYMYVCVLLNTLLKIGHAAVLYVKRSSHNLQLLRHGACAHAAVPL